METQIICMLPLVAYQLILLFTRKKRQTALRHELALLLFAFVILTMLLITGITPTSHVTLQSRPYAVNLVPGHSIKTMLKSNQGIGLFHIWGNILLFMPYSFLLTALWKRNGAIRTIAQGVCFSVFIEFLQMFLNRSSDVDDVLLNTIGCVLGFFAGRLFLRVTPRFSYRLQVERGGITQPWIMICIAIASICAYSVLHYRGTYLPSFG